MVPSYVPGVVGPIWPLATVPPLQAPQSLGVMTIGWLTVAWLPWLPPALEMASLQAGHL